MPWFPVAPSITIVALVLIFWASWLDTETGRPGLTATALQMAAAALYYSFIIRRRGAWAIFGGESVTGARGA
jgi:hypothetical protein